MNRFFLSLDAITCKILSLIYYTVCTYSLTTLALISVTRYKMLHMKKRVSHTIKKSAFLNIGINAFASVMCAIPSTLFMETRFTNYWNQHEYCVIIFHFTQVQTTYLSFKIIMFIIWGVLPTSIFSFFYIIFYKTLRITMIKKQKKTLFFISTLLLSFLIIQGPYIFALMFEMFLLSSKQYTCKWDIRRSIIGTIIRSLPHIHCLANPLVYAFSGTDFRQQLSYCTSCFLCNKKQFLRKRQRHLQLNSFRRKNSNMEESSDSRTTPM